MLEKKQDVALEGIVFSVVDVETTGLSAYRDRITEVAIVQVLSGQIIHTYSTLVNPQCPIPGLVQRLTGITDELVQGEPLFADVATKLRTLLQGTVIVAHNARFDTAFLREEFARCGLVESVPPAIDTVTLARKIIPGVMDYKLGTLCHHLRIVPGEHRALGDAMATAQLFAHMMKVNKGHIASRVKGIQVS